MLGSIQTDQSIRSDVFFDNRLLSNLPNWIQANIKPNKIIVLSHPEIFDFHGSDLLKSLEVIGCEVFPILVSEGEVSKSMSTTQDIISSMLDNQLERHDCLIAFGGGVIGDLGGFVASIYLRGIRFIQVPTSLLAQVDASIGGKTGINDATGKNLIGTFWQPTATWISPQFLSTLNHRERLNGLAEIIKYGVITDPTIFNLIESNIDVIQSLDFTLNDTIWHSLIQSSCLAKLKIVNQDVTEKGVRAILNFGHTIAHGIESAGSYSAIKHGEAVAVGMIAAAYIAKESSILSNQSFMRLSECIENVGFVPHVNGIQLENIVLGMKNDKKNIHGKFQFVLPTKIGHVTINNEISIALLKKAIQYVSC